MLHNCRTAVRTVCLIAIGLAPILAPRVQAAGNEPYEREISAFEEKDKAAPPAPGGILFTGSSSTRLWKLDTAFPELGALNRGFGGSKIEDSVRLMDRTVLPYKPRLIVFYAGDNDIGSGQTPEKVADDFKAFATKVHEALPKTKLFFITIKPSIMRWSLWDKMREANRLVEEFTKGKDWLGYIDITAVMLGADGKPRPELFMADGLHLNDDGYKLWNEIVRARIKEADTTGK